MLSPLVIDIAIPCLVFAEILTRFDPGKMNGWWILPLGWAGFTAFSGAMTWLVSRLGKSFGRELGMGLLYPNALFTPLVIIPGIFGLDTPLLSDLFLFTILFPMFLFNSYQLFFGQKTRLVKITWQKLLNPILVSTVIAVLIKLLGWGQWIPEVAISITKLVGAVSLPLVMILLGGNIYVNLEQREKFFAKELAFFVVAKNFLWPALILPLLIVIKLPFALSFLIFLQSTLPPVTTLPLLAKRIDGNEAMANQFVVASFLFSQVSIPLAIWVFSLFFPW